MLHNILNNKSSGEKYHQHLLRFLTLAGVITLTACGGSDTGSGSTPVDLGEPVDEENLPLGTFNFPINELNYNFDQNHHMQYWSSFVTGGSVSLNIEWQQDMGRPDPTQLDDHGAAVITPSWSGEDDSFVFETSFTQDVLGPPELETDQVDLTCGSVRYAMYLPETYTDAASNDTGTLRFRLFLQDNQDRRAYLTQYSAGDGQNIADNAAVNANALNWYDFNESGISPDNILAETGFDLAAVNHVGIEIDGEDLGADAIGDIRFDNVLMTPAVVQDCIGNFEVNHVYQEAFDAAETIDAWFEDFLEGSLTYTVSHSANGGASGGAMLFDFNWADAGNDKLLWARSLPENIDLTGRNLSVDINIPQAFIDDGNFIVKVYVKDSSFRYRNFGDVGAPRFVGGWNTIEYADISDSLEGFVSDGFDQTDVAMIGVEFVANGKPNSITGDVLVDNYQIFELIETQGGDTTAVVSYSFSDAAELDDWGVDWTGGELTEAEITVSQSTEGAGSMAFDVDWVSSTDVFGWQAPLTEVVDLTGSIVRARIYMPAAYVDDANLGMKIYTKDTAFVYGSLGWLGSSGFTGDAWNTFEVAVNDMDAFDFASPGYDMTSVGTIGVQIVANGKPANVSGTILVDDIEILVPAVNPVDFNFSSASQLDSWQLDWTGGELMEADITEAQSSDLGDGEMTLGVSWASSTDEFGWIHHLESPVDLTGAVVRADIYMPADVVNDGNLGMKIYTKDTSFVYGSLGWQGSAGFTADAWTTVEVLVSDETAYDFMSAGYDMTNVGSIGVQFVANGKPADVGGTIAVDNVQIILP